MEADLPNDEAFKTRIRSLLGLMRPMKALGAEKKRYGRDWDGGYVMLDTLETARIAYSLGICDDVSWDLCMAGFGADIYMYDHTIAASPQEHPRFHFRPIGIAADDTTTPNLRRLDTLMRDNGHEGEHGLVLKMDIESWEWVVFQTLPKSVIAQFDQIVCEFHHSYMFTKESWLGRAERALGNLHTTHQVVHVHGNNNAPFSTVGGYTIPDVWELTFANRGRYRFVDTDETFPTPLDMPCTPAKPEMELGRFAFT